MSRVAERSDAYRIIWTRNIRLDVWVDITAIPFVDVSGVRDIHGCKAEHSLQVASLNSEKLQILEHRWY